MTVTITGVHPYADDWAAADEPKLSALAEDIAANGQVHSIVVTPDGRILDGRQRYAACQLAGIEPRVVVTDLPEEQWPYFVVSVNAMVTDRTASQKAMSEALVRQRSGHRREGRWVGWTKATTSAHGQKSKGEQTALHRAGVVLDYAPDLAREVVAA